MTNNAEPGERPLTVYYNSACPVCRAGIAAQKGRMQQCEVVWTDVHETPAACSEVDASLAAVREQLHVTDAQGRVRVGVDAAVAIWRQSPGEAWKAWIFSLPVIHALAGLGYRLFARLLYRWNIRKGHW